MSTKTEPEGAQGNAPDNIEDFPEDDPIAHAEHDVKKTRGVINALLEEHGDCHCPVCTAVCTAAKETALGPVEGLWARLDEIISTKDDEAMMLYLGSLMTACSHGRASCDHLDKIAYAAHEAYLHVETKTTIAVAKTTAKALIGGDPEVLIGAVPNVPMPNMGGGGPGGKPN